MNKCITSFIDFNINSGTSFSSEATNLKVNLTRGNKVFTFSCESIEGTDTSKKCTIDPGQTFPNKVEHFGNYSVTFNNSLGEYYSFSNKVCLTDSCYYVVANQTSVYGVKKQRLVADNTIEEYKKYNTSFKVRFNNSWTGNPLEANIPNDLYVKTRDGTEPTNIRTLDYSINDCSFYYGIDNKTGKNISEVTCPYSGIPEVGTMFTVYYQPPCWPSIYPTGVNISAQDRNETFIAPNTLIPYQDCNLVNNIIYFNLTCDLPNGMEAETANGIANPSYVDYGVVLVKGSFKVFTECTIDMEATLSCRTVQEAPEWGLYNVVTNGTGYLSASFRGYKNGIFDDYSAAYISAYTSTNTIAFTKYTYDGTAVGVTNYDRDKMSDDEYQVLTVTLSKPYLGSLPEISASYEETPNDETTDGYRYNIIIQHCVANANKTIIKCPIYSYTLKGVDNGVIAYVIRFADGCGVRRNTGLYFNVTSQNFVKINVILMIALMLIGYLI